MCGFSGTQSPSSVLGARYPALGVDSVPGIGSQVPGTRDLRPGTRYRIPKRNAWLTLRKTRTRGMQDGSVSPRVSNVAIRQSGSSGMIPTPLAGVLSKPCTPVRVRPTAIPLATFQALAF
jgi:hypothetical protein